MREAIRVELTPGTKLEDILKAYPFLLDFFKSRSPRFKILDNPLLRKTMGRAATMERVAVLGGLPLDRLLTETAAEIRAKAGKEAAISIAGGSSAQAAQLLDPEARLAALKGIIRDLHAGAAPEAVKERLRALIRDVDAAEVARMEQQLIAEGMPQEEVKRLCGVHVKVFQDALDRQEPPHAPAGHPVHTYLLENRAAEEILAEMEEALRAIGEPPSQGAFQERRDGLGRLLEKFMPIDRHYLRKENQLFPLLEERGISGPTEVMWGIHDDIRALLKQAQSELGAGKISAAATLAEMIRAARDMIYKEEHILLPMALEVLSAEDWPRVRRGEEEIGYAWAAPGTDWHPAEAGAEAARAAQSGGDNLIELETGRLTPEQINLILTHLPVDISFINEHDEVAYYSQTPERIFTRSPGVIGRRVHHCHPPKSVPVVQKILEAFKAGTKDVAEFHLEMGGRFIHIRYYAVRDREGGYRGALEVSQDVTGIRKLQGERRLLDWE